MSKASTPFGEYLTVSGAAHSLKVTRQAILKAIRNNNLPAIKMGNQHLISKSDLDHYRRTVRIGRPPKDLKKR